MRVAQELLTNYQHVLTELKIVAGSRGIFNITVDGQLIYSKHETGRFPNEGEALSRLEPLLPEGTRPFGT